MSKTDAVVDAESHPGHGGPEKTDVSQELVDGFTIGFYKKLVAKVGYPVNRKRIIDINLACKMRDAGWSCNQIGKIYDLSGATIKNRLKEAGRYY
jgi:hypothetical protein